MGISGVFCELKILKFRSQTSTKGGVVRGVFVRGAAKVGQRWLAAIVGIGLHTQPDCVATTGFHNKVSTVPESPWPKLDVEQSFEIQIQNFNRFFCNRFWDDFFVQNVVRKQIQIWNLVLIFGRAQGYNFVAIQLLTFFISRSDHYFKSYTT